MLIDQPNMERGIASLEAHNRDQSANKGLWHWFQKSQYRRFLTIADWIASIAVLDMEPELYTRDCDRYSDRDI